jgi:hypothetical protein
MKLDRIIVDKTLAQIIEDFLIKNPDHKISLEICPPGDTEKIDKSRLALLGDEALFKKMLSTLINQFSGRRQLFIVLKAYNDFINISLKVDEIISLMPTENSDETFKRIFNEKAKGLIALPEIGLELSGFIDFQSTTDGSTTMEFIFPNEKLLCFTYFDNFD